MAFNLLTATLLLSVCSYSLALQGYGGVPPPLATEGNEIEKPGIAPPPESLANSCVPLELFGISVEDLPEECVSVDDNGCAKILDDCLNENAENDLDTAPLDTSPPSSNCIPLELFGVSVETLPEECVSVDENGCTIILEDCLNDAEGDTEETATGNACVPVSVLFPFMVDVDPSCIILDENECETVDPVCLTDPMDTDEEGTEPEGYAPADSEPAEMMPVADGEDGHEWCCFWAQEGECDVNPYWMRPQCQKSCGTSGCSVEDAESCEVSVMTEGCPWTVKGNGMGSSGGNAPPPSSYGGSSNKQAPSQMGGCMNMNKLCNYWGSKGECENNASWMNSNCAKACGQC